MRNQISDEDFKVIEEGFKHWNGSIKILQNSCFHSVANHTENGYKSVNWKDKKYVSNDFIRNRTKLIS